MMRRQEQQQEEQVTRMLYDLSSLVLNMLRSPPSPLQFPDQNQNQRLPAQITPSGFASLMFGVSLVLMLSGSVTFFIGFMLMPWVIGLAMLFYLVALLSTLSVLGRSIFGSHAKHVSEWKLL